MQDEARSFPAGRKTWTPRNFSGRYDGQNHAMRDALAQSINSIAVAVANEVGPERVADFARRAGIQSELDPRLPLALGASSVAPLELANAYATIANGGKVAEPILVTRIADRTGKDVYLAKREPGRQVINEDTTKQLTDMLGDVVRRGSGKEAQKAGRPVVGKTGTSNGGRDVWFAGFSADLCAVVWIGYDDRKPMPKATGGTLAVPMWTEFMRVALERVPVRPLPRLPHLFDAALPAAQGLPSLDPEPSNAPADEALEDPHPPPPPELPKIEKRAEP
jgi:penicillin-binding protein 1A